MVIEWRMRLNALKQRKCVNYLQSNHLLSYASKKLVTQILLNLSAKCNNSTLTIEVYVLKFITYFE